MTDADGRTPESALLEAIRALSSDLDEASVLADLVESVTRVLGAESAELVLVDAEQSATPGRADPRRGPGSVRRIQVPVQSRGRQYGTLTVSRVRGDPPFSAFDEEVATTIAGAAGAVLERTYAHRLGERRRQWLEATASLTDSFEPPFSLARALDAITRQVCAVSQAQAAAVMQLRDGDTLVLAQHGTRAADRHAPEVAVAVEVAASCLAVQGVPSADVEVDSDSELVIVMVPLRSHVATDGVLAIVHADRARARDFDERQLLLSFAEQAGLSLDRAQAIEDRQSLQDVSQRDQVSRTLHDTVIQRLFATGMRLQGLQYVAPEGLAEPLERVADDLDRIIKDVRGTVFRSNPSGTAH